MLKRARRPTASEARPPGLPAAATVAYLCPYMLAPPRTLPTDFIAPCLPTKTDKLPSAANGCMRSSTMASASLPARLARTSARWSASWASMVTPPAFVTAAAAIPCGTREELASGLCDVLFMQQIIRKANHGALKNPLFRCVIVSVPAFCHWSERTSARTKLWCKLSGGLHHAEDSNCTGCILGDAE